MNLKEIRLEKGIAQDSLAKAIHTTVPMISYFENYKCLPTPPMLDDMCNVLECEKWEIYDFDELFVDMKKANSKIKVHGKIKPSIYKLTVELPNNTRCVLTQSNLEKCGYHSLKDFIWHCFKSFEKKLKKIDRKEKTTEQCEC